MHTIISRSAAVLAVAGAFAAGAPVASAMTIRAGDPTLVDRVALTVPVSVSCSPFDPAYSLYSTSVSVSVQQPSGKDIANGWGYVAGGFATMGSPSLLFACDDVEHSVTVPVSVNAAGPPFHGGHAVVNATAWASAGQPCYPGSTTCYLNPISQSASTGPVEVHL